MPTLAILNQKGGVGKTTTAVNLGAALALRGLRVLLVDADPQANLTDHLAIDLEEGSPSIYEVLTGEALASEAIRPTATDGLFLLASHPDLAAIEQEIAEEAGREQRLASALASLKGQRFDWIIVDCPPSLGLLALNAMAAAELLVVTLQTEYFALRGLGQLDRVVGMVREAINPRLRFLGILPTLVNPVTRLAREVLEEVRAHYGDLVFHTRIRQNVRLAEAPGHRQHIFAYEPLSAGAADYAALADEVLHRSRPAALSSATSPPLEVSAARAGDTGNGRATPGEGEEGLDSEPGAAASPEVSGTPAT